MYLSLTFLFNFYFWKLVMNYYHNVKVIDKNVVEKNHLSF